MERPWTYYLLLVVAWLATLWGLWQIGDAWVTWPTIDSAAARDIAHGKLWLAGGLILGGLALGGLATLIGLVQDGFARLATQLISRALQPSPAREAAPQVQSKAEIGPEPRPEAKPEAKCEAKFDAGVEAQSEAKPAVTAEVRPEPAAPEPRSEPRVAPRLEPKREPRLEPAVRLSSDASAAPREPRLDPPRPGNGAPTRREPKLLRDS
jgi:hypothetical protein